MGLLDGADWSGSISLLKLGGNACEVPPEQNPPHSNSPISGGFLSGDSSTSLMDLTQGGDDVLTVKMTGQYADASSSMYGDAPIMAGQAHGGNDILNGSSGRDFM